jgi:hypothetical protein
VVKVSVPVKWYSKRKHKHSSTRDSASRSVVSHDVVITQDARYCDKWIMERKVNDDGYKDLGDWLATWASLQYHAQASNLDNKVSITAHAHAHAR